MNKEKKKGVIKKIKKEYIIVALLCVIAVYFVFSLSDSLKGKSVNKESTTENDYATVLENKLTQALSKVDGVGNVTVKISLGGTIEKVYVTNETVTETSSNKTIKTENVLVGGQLVENGEVYPDIIGILIVSSGAKNITVRQNIMDAVVTFLNVDSSKVIILNGKK